MKNKIILITGATNGLGKEMAIKLAKNNNLILLGRNSELLVELKNNLLETTKYKIDTYVCDFSNLDNVYQVVDQIKSNHEVIDLIINNAGALIKPDDSSVHPALLVNFLSPFTLNQLLMETLMKSKSPTIFYTTTMALAASIDVELIKSMNNAKRIKSYSVSKLAFNLYLFDLVNKYSNLLVKVFDPKIVYTNAIKTMLPKGLRWIAPVMKLFAKNPQIVASKAIDVLDTDGVSEGFHYYRLDDKTNIPEEIIESTPQTEDILNWANKIVEIK